MVLNPLNSSNVEQLAFNWLTSSIVWWIGTKHKAVMQCSWEDCRTFSTVGLCIYRLEPFGKETLATMQLLWYLLISSQLEHYSSWPKITSKYKWNLWHCEGHWLKVKVSQWWPKRLVKEVALVLNQWSDFIEILYICILKLIWRQNEVKGQGHHLTKYAAASAWFGAWEYKTRRRVWGPVSFSRKISGQHEHFTKIVLLLKFMLPFPRTNRAVHSCSNQFIFEQEVLLLQR